MVPAGLSSASLERVELVNTNMGQVHALTGHGMLPNLASVLITERARGVGEGQCCEHIASL